MIIETEIYMANHEARSMEKPWVFLREHTYQTGYDSVKGFMMYNVVAGHYHGIGSTVTIQSMLDLGLRVEIVR